jgi:pimeloyl-ACP methyl ester carboxylesterase
MLKRLVLTLTITAAAALSAQDQGQYATVNGLRMYYELHGPASASPPLVLLHGGVVGITMFGPNLAALAEHRRVIAVELQGHGHTADIDRPLRCELMADDIAALLKQLGIARAHVLGYSLGACVALQFVIRHPELVRRLVLVSTSAKRSGYFPDVLAAFDHMGPEAGAQMKQSPLATMYPNVNWTTLFAKLGDLLRQNYDWTADVAKITAPVMLVYADADIVTPAQIMEFWGLVGGGKRDAGLDGSGRPPGRLAIVPGTTHYNILETDAVARMVTPFLDRP